MGYDLSTTLNNSSNNSVSDNTVAGFEKTLQDRISSGLDTTGEDQAVLTLVQSAVSRGLLNLDGVVGGVPADNQLSPGPGNLYIAPPGSNLTVSAPASQAGQVVNVLQGENTDLTLSNSGGQARYNVIVAGGQNTTTLNKGPSEVTSTIGNDTIVSRGGKDTITGGSGHDTITAGGKSFVQAGTAGDTVTGGLRRTSHDTIVGGSGTDQLVVSHGNNVLVGTTGHTYMQAGDGLDTILGGTGRETIWGSGSTYIQAAKGNIIHGQGSDTIYGGAGRNTILSGNGGQYIEGAKGHLDITVSKTANDTIFGGSHHDVVHIAQSEANIADITTSGLTQTITFANGQTLTTQNVTIEFKDHHK